MAYSDNTVTAHHMHSMVRVALNELQPGAGSESSRRFDHLADLTVETAEVLIDQLRDAVDLAKEARDLQRTREIANLQEQILKDETALMVKRQRCAELQKHFRPQGGV